MTIMKRLPVLKNLNNYINMVDYQCSTRGDDIIQCAAIFIVSQLYIIGTTMCTGEINYYYCKTRCFFFSIFYYDFIIFDAIITIVDKKRYEICLKLIFLVV